MIFEVEHGDDTDALEQFIANAISNTDYEGDHSVSNYTVKVDLPECFVLETE